MEIDREIGLIAEVNLIENYAHNHASDSAEQLSTLGF